MSRLFEPIQLGPLQLANRIIIAPMCQYSAEDGSATDWHLIHLGHLALSGAGLLICEATGVCPEGRISPQDLGLYSDANETALARVLAGVRRYSSIPFAVQLAHAGRKASVQAPWLGGAQIPPGAPMGWKTRAPSPLPFNEGADAPAPLDDDGIALVRDAFAAAARRAARIGVDGIEIHAAHGYLLHEFMSPLSNRRTDRYGGSLENRMRLTLEVFDAVRHAFAAERPVWVRISASDWVEGGWDIDSSVVLARELKARGCAAIHVSSGGLSPAQSIKAVPGYQVPFANRIKADAGITTFAVGLITEPEHAEAILAAGDADAIALARAILYDPRWPWHAAAKLGARVDAPPQYWRSQPAQYRELFRTGTVPR
jgi:2,4-dienoyl-CoA reductase-like NADH-dependent reductase (Old Yellow Enzyme family)